MPELGEVEYNRRIWDPGVGGRVDRVDLHAATRCFRGEDADCFLRWLPGSVLRSSECRGKQILFRFSGDLWLGVHLGMTGALRCLRDGEAPPGRHEHLRLHQKERSLVYSDPRQFGRLRLDRGKNAPGWWKSLPPEVLSAGFTLARVRDFLARHARAPIKAVLLDQECFPGIGNWMADEILWRCGFHPSRPAGKLDEAESRALWREIRQVSRVALRRIGKSWGDLPREWLFHSRWSDGGSCPRTGVALVRERIGGRTACWSPGRQTPPRSPASRRKAGSS
jgi:formamidopyrimidine-DNA glycosylase